MARQPTTDLQLQIQCLVVAGMLGETFFSTNKKLAEWALDVPTLRKHLVVEYQEAQDLESITLNHSYGGWELRYMGSRGGEHQLGGRRMSKTQLYDALRLMEEVLKYAKRTR